MRFLETNIILFYPVTAREMTESERRRYRDYRRSK